MRVNIPTRFSNRPMSKMRILYFATPVVAIAIILAIGIAITAAITGDSARRFSRQYSIEAAANFITGTNAHFLLSQQLANSVTIARWMSDEDDEELKARAVEEIMGYAKFVPDMLLVFTAYDTRNMYDLHPGFTAEDIVPTRQLPGLPYSQWFFDARDAELPFNLNIQRSTYMDDQWTINAWTNHRMYYQGRFVAIVTTGTPFTNVFNNMFGNFDIATQRGYIINQYGLVRADSAELLEVFENGWPRSAVLPEAVDNPDLADAINLHLQTMVDGAFRVGGTVGDAISLQGDFRYASVAPIIGTNWSVVVLSNQEGVFGSARFILLLFIGFAALILFVWGSVVLMHGAEREGFSLAQAIVASAPFVINLWDDSRNLLSTNPHAVKLYGVSDEEQYIERFYEISPEYQPCGTPSADLIPDIIDKAYKDGYIKFDWLHCTLDGKQIPTEVTIVRFERHGKPMLVSYAIDLSQIKEAQEKEREAERQLAKVAEESNRAKSAFLARMSHEIRTPITAVMGISEIELQDPDLSPHLEESFAKMHNAANHLLNIVNDVLDLSKIEAGKMELLQEKYEVASMIVDAIQLNAALNDGKDVKLNVSIDENLPAYLIGDVVRIKQIINNILSNAFKYTEAGTVELSLHCHKEAPEEDEYVAVVISIIDTGYGMTAKQLEDITNEYTRHHEREFRNIDGTGLGMPIVYSLAQMMGAEIDIDSEVGVGTSVVVRIPQKVVGSEVLGKELAFNLQQFEYVMKITGKRFGVEPEPMPYGSVLVVDDVDANLYVTRGLLAFYDLQIETCTNGYDAVKLIEQGNVYDMILLDHMMPGMNGTETMLRLRELGYWHPIVVLTADAIIGQAEEFIKSGFDGFISKPIQTKRLNDLLVKHIKNKQPPEVIEAANALSAENIQKGDIDSFQRSPVLLAQLRLDFANNYSNTFSELCSSIDADDMETARRLAHTIKGAAGLLCEDALSDIANEVEQVLAKNEKPKSNQLSALGREIDRVLADAAEIGMPSQTEEYMGIEEALILLEEITPLLADGNVAALKMTDELRKIPQSGLLCSQIERFDFRSALETAIKLKNEMGTT